jgi:hypothetical protein
MDGWMEKNKGRALNMDFMGEHKAHADYIRTLVTPHAVECWKKGDKYPNVAVSLPFLVKRTKVKKPFKPKSENKKALLHELYDDYAWGGKVDGTGKAPMCLSRDDITDDNQPEPVD